MRLPDFLIIGAMKAGTTSLYRDLLANPAVFMPHDKEPNSLTGDDVLTDAGRSKYARLFDRAGPHQVCGEASTTYTQLPDITGVPARARKLLGERVRLIYLVRHPVERAISHHHHILAGGHTNQGFDEALKHWPRFIDYSLYAMQVKAWLEHFPRENLLIVLFERYIRERRATVESISRFLGVPADCSAIDADAAHNRTEGKPVAPGWARLLHDNVLYKRLVRDMLPTATRERLKRLVSRRAPARPPPPSLDVIRVMLDAFRPDAFELARLMGLSEPPWDLSEQWWKNRESERGSRPRTASESG